MRKYKIKFFLSLTFLIIVFSLATVNYSLADKFIDPAEIKSQVSNFSGAGGANFDTNATIGSVVAAAIKGFIALLGVIFVVLIILAGYKWMNAGGEEEKVREAKDTIRHAIIGLIIIIAAYAITEFVFTHLPWGAGTVGPG
ncbi:hypothetical protein KAU19_07025 [Candidatus Parcubacteria bacterium]|nr:hypothetical protein [Candidatus Parcubacteria bacterium]